MAADGRVERDVAGAHFPARVAVPHGAGAADDEVAFPLRGVRVERAAGLAGEQLAEFQIEGMPAVGEVGVHLGAERFRDLFARTVIFSRGRGPFHPGHGIEVNVEHGEVTKREGAKRRSRFWSAGIYRR